MTQRDPTDPLYRATLPAMRCMACRGWMPIGWPRVGIVPSWVDHDDIMCQGCWTLIMEAAQVGFRSGAGLQFALELPE